ncbi:MAG TPA: flagellar filament capping protein FliD, partial [Thermoguttaceae bacterium]
ITDSKGVSGTVNVNDNIQTVGDLLKAINLLPSNVLAEINDTGDGIVIRDSSGGPVALKVEEYGSTTARDLNLLGDAVTVEIDGQDTQVIDGSMTRTIDLSAVDTQVIGLDTKLADLNRGTGVARGRFKITNTNGKSGTVDLTNSNIKTVGDLVSAINSLSINVTAAINDTKDGIVIRDANNGPNTLKIEEQGSTTAEDLNLLGAAITVDIDGHPTQVIDGSTAGKPITYSLQDLRDKINQLGAGVTASILSDGSDKPYRLMLVSNQTGKANQVVLDSSQADIAFDEIARAQDALLGIGNTGTTGTGLFVSSRTNSFSEVLSGATITIEDVSTSPVTISVTLSDTDIVANIKILVDNYNKFCKKLNEDTAYDTENNVGSVLTGDNSALQLDIDMSGLISERYSDAATFQSLAEVGIGIQSDGTISLDETKLRNALAAHRDAVKQLFTAEDTGVSARFAKVIERLAGPDSSLLELRNQALQDTVDRNQKRMDDMDVQLDNQRTRLLNQFYQMELAIAKLQSNLTALSSIQWILDSNSNSFSLFNNNS